MKLRNLLFLFFLFRENFSDEFSDDISGSPTTGLYSIIIIFYIFYLIHNLCQKYFEYISMTTSNISRSNHNILNNNEYDYYVYNVYL